MYHTAASSGPLVLLLIDLETTGTSVGCCIVELAAAQAVNHLGSSGACFAQVVRAPDEVLRSQEAQAAEVLRSPRYSQPRD